MITITLAQGADAQKLIGELQAAGITATQRENMLDVEHVDLVQVKALCLAYMPQRPQEDIDRENAQTGAVTGFQTLPTFLKTMTADEAVTHIHGAVLGGKTSAQIDLDIDNLANSVAGMKIGLKTIGASLIAIRDILELVAKLLLYIRDLVLKYRA